MIRLHIIYQWRSDELTNGFFKFWDSLIKESELQITFYDIEKYDMKDLSKADRIIFSNVINKKALIIAEEAARSGISTIYDSRIAESGAGALSALVKDSVSDLRSQNITDRLIRIVDLVTSDSSRVSERYTVCASYFKIIKSDDMTAWKALLSSLEPASSFERRETGKKIFVIAPTFMWPHHYICDMLTEAFMNMGHRVHLFTVKPTAFLSEAVCWKKEFDNKFLDCVAYHQEDAWKIKPTIDREDPDLIFTVQGYAIPRQMLQEIKNTGIPFVSWFMDEPYDSARSLSFSRYFSHVFIQDEASLSFQRHFGNPNTFYLPHGCMPDASALAKTEYKRDVALLGNPFPRRIKLVEYLASKGISVTVTGSAWKKVINGNQNINVIDNIPLNKTSRFFRETKIILNMHRSSDDFSTNKNSFIPESPNGTLFYIAASAGFQLVDSGRDELKNFFEHGKEIVTFDSESDCYKKVMHYLSHESEREKIRLAGCKRAIEHNTYAKRLQQMLDTVKNEQSIPVDSSHRRIGFISTSASLSGFENLPDRYCCTVLSENKIDHKTKENIKIVMPDKSRGFASALNAAIFETSADYFVLHSFESFDPEMYEKIVDRFEEDMNLGIITIKSASGCSGFIIPQRILDEAGTLQYKNADMCVIALYSTVVDIGYTASEVWCEGLPVSESWFSASSDEEERARFYRDWTSDHNTRLQARRLLRLLETNAYKISPDEAYSTLEKIVSISPQFGEAQKKLAELSLSKGKFRNALDCYETLWEIDPSDPVTILSYSAALCIHKEFDKAFELLGTLADTDATALQIASMHYQKGRIMLAKGDNAAAMESFKSVLEFDPTHLNALKEIGLLMFNNGDTEGSLIQLSNALVFSVGSAASEILNDMGVVNWQIGNTKEALSLFDRALEKSPSNKSAVINLATVGRGLLSDEEIKEYIYDCLGFYPHDTDLLKLLEAMNSSVENHKLKTNK
ncbi:MAG: glycosyltransferase [Nitrospirae bacterium]|nr:glycosyltransferase [Nitrospirota bacterium]